MRRLYIIIYIWLRKWFWLKVWNNFEEVSEKLLKCNQDVKEIKAKINRMLWISETMVGKWIWITKKNGSITNDINNRVPNVYD